MAWHTVSPRSSVPSRSKATNALGDLTNTPFYISTSRIYGIVSMSAIIESFYNPPSSMMMTTEPGQLREIRTRSGSVSLRLSSVWMAWAGM